MVKLQLRQNKCIQCSLYVYQDACLYMDCIFLAHRLTRYHHIYHIAQHACIGYIYIANIEKVHKLCSRLGRWFGGESEWVGAAGSNLAQARVLLF